MDKFSIIIPTMLKDKELLSILIENLIKQELVGEIIIIDNSTKGFEYSSDKVKILVQTENIYVNPAWNLGIEVAKYNLFGILNDDLLIPNNLISEVYEFINKHSNCGVLGVESSSVVNEIEDYNLPEDKTIIFNKIYDIREGQNWFWGISIFGKKENYYKIPQKMKIYCGDDYLLLMNKKHGKTNYMISGCTINHIGRLTSGDEKFEIIKILDTEFYEKLDKKFKKYEENRLMPKFKPLEYIFCIKNYNKIYKIIMILGIKLRIRKKEYRGI